MITLRPPVKAALLYQPVQRIVAEVAVAAVLVSQTDDTSGSIVLGGTAEFGKNRTLS